MRKCRICDKRDDHGNGSFFKIPKDGELRWKWCQASGIALESGQFICDDHFLPSDIVRGAKKSVLLTNAIPFVVSDLCQTPPLE